MPNSNNPIKFVHLQILANQLVLHGANVKEIVKVICSCFYESKKILGCLIRREKITEWWKYTF